MKHTTTNQLNKLIVVALVVVVCIFLAFAFDHYAPGANVYTHLFYIPVILAGAWFKKKAYFVSAVIGIVHIWIEYSKAPEFTLDPVIRAAALFATTFVVVVLANRNSQLQEVLSEQLVSIQRANESLEAEVAEHGKALELLYESQQRFKSIVNALPDILFIVDQDGVFIDFEANAITWNQTSRDAILGKKLYEVFPKEVAAICMGKIKDALNTNKLQTFEYQEMFEGTENYYDVRLIKFQHDQVFTIVRNITETRKMQLTNEYLSYHDQLTGVYNRRYFEDALIQFDSEEYLPIAIAMADVNGLKLTNDAFGHQTGDKLLRLVTDILCKNRPKHGFISRIGGDEFVIICPNTSQEEMAEMNRSIYTSVNREKKKHPILSLSIGWEIKTTAEQTMTDVFNKAEEQMYRKKLTESQSSRNQTIQAIMKTLNEKNTREKIHSERVSTISRLIGEAMNLDYGTVKEIETAGLLHDIGKIAVDENILNKEGRLTDDEYSKIKKHPESSYQILKSINAYAGLAEDVLSHHERLDGNGYPRRLKGDEISLIARIICVADAYEAMTADRTYRTAMAKDDAIIELKRCVGTQFDEEIVRIFEEKVCKLL
jgi:diguanylate cyclase (GGDEF)-like protein